MELELIERVRFDDLSPDAQVELAAYAVLLKSFPPPQTERAKAQLRNELHDLGGGLSRAFGEIFKIVGLRSRKQHNNMRRTNVNARAALNQKFTPGNQRTRPAKRKATV